MVSSHEIKTTTKDLSDSLEIFIHGWLNMSLQVSQQMSYGVVSSHRTLWGFPYYESLSPESLPPYQTSYLPDRH